MADTTFAGTAFAGRTVAGRAVAGSEAVRPVKTVDVDGDNRADTVTVTQIRRVGTAADYVLAVRTARGRRVTVPFRASLDGGLSTPFGGVAQVDGVRGAEIFLTMWVNDGSSSVILTWRGGRSGRLVNLEPPPIGTEYFPRGHQWYVLADPYVVGYTFATSRGVRYVTAANFEPMAGGLWRGTLVTSALNGVRWRAVTRRSTRVTQRVAQAYGGFRGLRFL